MMIRKLILWVALILCSFGQVSAQTEYFFPAAGKMNPAIPTPEQFFGYAIGTQHTRHDRLVEYFKELDRLSDRLKIQVIGETYEHRQQIAAIYTSVANHAKLEDIRKQHIAAETTGDTKNIPLIIHLGYNVHGNEPSSSEAAILTAYYLAASESPETLTWLNDMVILMDPNINPDGRDRHSHWANMHKAEPAVADPQDREHNEIWPGGRFNHYWFDLNRDWFPAVHPESVNRIRFFHYWRPYVQTDHHEQGTNATFYFDPGKYSSNNPVVPPYLYDSIYPKFGETFAKAADKLGSLYYTKEAYDKLYPGYGSSYINFYGGAGFLFEQASSRGHVQETTTIPLTFAFTIRNHAMASISTIRTSLKEKKILMDMRRIFFQQAIDQAKKSTVKGYVFNDANDKTRTKAFLDLLLLHNLDVYNVTQTTVVNGKKFEGGTSYWVPTEQNNYIMVKTIFEKDITYTDSTFYDASTWSLVHAYGLPFAELKTPLSLSEKITNVTLAATPTVSKSDYAYLFELTDYNAHKAIFQLQKGGAIVQTAFNPYSVAINGKAKKFGYGSISIPVQQQNLSSDSLYRLVSNVSRNTNITIYSLSTGYSVEGIDLGSSQIKTVKKPEVAMVIGTGVAATEAGEIWHLLDQRLQMPISKIDILTLGRASLSRYNTLIMVSGIYTLLDKNTTDKIKTWVQNGGTLITLKTGSEWAIKQGFTKERLLVDSSKSTGERFNFDEAQDREGAKALGGSIFKVDLDTTHPIGFGFSDRKVSIYRNGLTILLPSQNAYSTVAKYTENPLVGGYLHPTSAKKIKNSAAILVGAEGAGRVIMFSDDPNFRGTWYGTNKLFLNALFFGGLINVPSGYGGEL